MAERAHPDDPAFQGTVWARAMEERYTFCLPLIQGKQALDIPCGTGWGTSLLTGVDTLTGVDVDPEAIRYGNSRFSGIGFCIGRMESLPFASNCFDVVVCLEGLEHIFLSDAKLFLAEAHRVLRTGGTIIVTAPMLKDGKHHSGNPFHYYEFTDSELRSLLEQHFETVSLEIFRGPEGFELRYVGRTVEHERHVSPVLSHSIQAGAAVSQWLPAMRADTGFRFGAATPCTLVSTCIAILLHEGLGSLGAQAQQERESWRRYLQSCQDPSSGLFLDPLLKQFPVESTLHDHEYTELQMTYFAIQALDALDSPAAYPLHFLTPFEIPGALVAWLGRLSWSNPWLESNRVMFVLAGLIHRVEKEGRVAAAELYHQVLDWLNRTQDTKTGLWGAQQGASVLNAIAGAYHFVPFYEYVHRPVCAVTKIVDAGLSLQQSDGLFGGTPGGGACEDVDVIDLLATFTKQYDYRALDIKKSLVRAFWSILNLQNADGGFPYAASLDESTYRFGSWAPLEVKRGESDVFASWFRLIALETIACTFPDDLPKLDGWCFRRWPALGFHHAGQRLTNREGMGVWIRPLSLPPGTIDDPNTTPDVTAVITCYNLGRYLHEAIDSVLRQSLRTWEIVIVDDGSTDEFTALYIDLLNAPKTRVIRTSNQGLPAARNLGIQLARGRYICCLDADDRLLPAFLERARRSLDDAQDVGFVSCYYETFDNDHAVYRYDHCRFPELLVQNEGVVASVFRKEAWRKVGGYCTGLRAMQDWDFWISIIEQGYRGEVIPEILFEYRARAGSMYTVTSRPENYSSIAARIIERHEETYRRYFPIVLRLKTRQFAELVAIRRQELEDFARARNLLDEQIRNLRQIADERQKTLVAYTAAKAWLEQQMVNWQQVASQRQETIEAFETGKAWLAQQVANWQRTAEERQRRIVELEYKEATLSRLLLEKENARASRQRHIEDLAADLQRERRSVEERLKCIAEMEQQAENWRAVAQQRDARITALAETIAGMRGTRAWRLAEWSVGVLRGFSGFFRAILLVGSPRRATSKAKNLFLRLRLAVGPDKGRATWREHFDANFYTDAYPDVARSGIRPGLHYLLSGYAESRNPSQSFDSAYYCLRNPDVRQSGINPLLHYALFGREEQRGLPTSLGVPKAVRPASSQTQRRSALFTPDAATPSQNSDTPLVSVVIPCFNYGQYVEEAIRSVLSQTFTNLEIIVVEGGSTDGTTPAVLQELERRGYPKTRFVYRSEPQLVGDNRNFGIDLARGRYICCLDADDLIKATYIEVAVFLAESYGFDFVYPSVRSFGESDFRWLLCDPTWPEIADGNQISTVAVFRKMAWKHVGGFRDWEKGAKYVPEDWEFWARLVGHGFRGKCIREPLMQYRVHREGLWAKRGLTMQQQSEVIKASNPQLFANGHSPSTTLPDRPAATWDNLLEPDGSQPAILFALPFISIGGAEKVFETLGRSLVRRGYKLVVITTLVLAETIRDCTEGFEDVTPYVYPLPRLFENDDDRWRDFFFYLLKRHHVGAILIAGCDFLYRLLPEIDISFPHIAILDQLFNGEVHYPTNRRYAAHIDATFVPSRKLAEQLIFEGREDPGKVVVVPHGIDMSALPSPDATVESSSLPQHFRGKFLVSFFGRLSAEKGPVDFVEIAKHLRSYDEIRFLMTGEGQERAAVLSLIDKYKLRDRIHAPGFVEDAHKLMALSDVVVVPSRLDGMPLVVFEAQACGKPVVASAVGSIPHVIEEGKTGFLCAPGDVNGFAERILNLWRSPEMCRAIGDAARVWVRANHSAESMTDKYIEAFDRVRPGKTVTSTLA